MILQTREECHRALNMIGQSVSDAVYRVFYPTHLYIIFRIKVAQVGTLAFTNQCN